MTHPPTEARVQFDAWRARAAENWFATDTHLQSLLARYGRSGDEEALSDFGARCATTIDTLVRENNRDENLPRLRRWDGQGNRIEQVEFHPSYHELGREVYATGLMSRYVEPGHELETLAFLYLYAQNGEAGHACPIACTAGLIKILQASGGDHGAWLERLLDPSYDRHFHGSQFLTEVQGGSDVGANAVVARPEPDGTWRISGEKWFCSVIDAHLFLVTARPLGAPDGTRGLRAFAVPRSLPDGQVNGFELRRLKYKLGTRSMASAEVDFRGALAVPVGDFHDVVGVVLNTSRLYNAVCSASMMQRAWRDADAYARTRMAFGQPILRFPAVARRIARLRTEAAAARGLTFFLADLADRTARGEARDLERAAWRMLVNLNKYWTSIVGTSCAREAIETLGGNGAIEEFSVLPRLLRDSIVCEAWEGSHDVLCAQALRDARRYRLHEPMFAVLEELGGPSEALERCRARWAQVVSSPDGEIWIRDVVDELRPVAQAAALRGDGDALATLAAEHLLATSGPGYDPLSDEGLMTRVTAINQA